MSAVIRACQAQMDGDCESTQCPQRAFSIPGPVYGRPPHEKGCDCFECFVGEAVERGESERDAAFRWNLKAAGMVE